VGDRSSAGSTARTASAGRPDQSAIDATTTSPSMTSHGLSVKFESTKEALR
jgi:hypothetical protein